VYLSLIIEPRRVDVNMHPTKREVGFLNEDEIIEKLCAAVQSRLGERDQSRRFTVQTLLPGAKPIETATQGDDSSRKMATNYLVRTDPATRKITTMFSSQMPLEREGEEGYEVTEKEHVPVKLGSIRELREQVMEDAHNGILPLN
jgi:DNA mismatch repair protein MLH1